LTALFFFTCLVGLSQSYESVFYVPDSTTVFGRILPRGQMVVDRSSNYVWIIDSTTSATTYTLETWDYKTIVGGGTGEGSVLAFDSDRPILRGYEVNDVIGGNDIFDFARWLYFAAPTLSISLNTSTTSYEIGTENAINITGAISNPGSATLSNGYLIITSESPNIQYHSFLDSASFTAETFNFNPVPGNTGNYGKWQYTFMSKQSYSGGGESGIVQSSTSTIYGGYPAMILISTNDYSSDLTGFYAGATKITDGNGLGRPGNKTVDIAGRGYIYYLMPTTWGDTDLSSILDHNGFEQIESFTKITGLTYSSTGLDNDWSGISVVLYKYDDIVERPGGNPVDWKDWQFIR
jgi:hypothetical protein